jgi:hypothetical protein
MVAIGRLVLTGREHITGLEPVKNGGQCQGPSDLVELGLKARTP